MPKKINLNEMRNWMELYDKGISIATIAKKKHHDIRTIDRGIKQARQVLDVRQARTDMVKDALQRHQKYLSEVIELLQTAVVMPPLDMTFPAEDAFRKVVSLPQAKAEYINNAWAIKFDFEENVKWEIFEEHITDDPVKGQLSRWKASLDLHLQKRYELSQLITQELCHITELPVLKTTIDKAPKNYLLPAGISAMYFFTINRALGNPVNQFERELQDDDPYMHFGEQRLPILLAPGRVSEYMPKVIEAYKKVINTPVINKIISTNNDLEEITKKVSKSLEELSLLGFVPGECHVCRRIGL